MTDRAVLFSIKPKYCELIASGKKTVEVRKTRPKLETPFKCYIYCTQTELLTKSHLTGKIYVASNKKYKKLLERRGNLTLSGKVVGEFVCDEIISFGFTPYNHGEYMVSFDVNNEHDILKASCLSFNEMYEYIGENVGYGYHISKLVIYDTPKELSEFGLKRAPQSWCYVQEVTDNA